MAALVPSANGVQVIVLAGSRSQPVTEEQARPAIEQFILNERRRKLVEDDVKALRAAAKIEYVGKFAEPAASAPAGTAPAASGPGAAGRGELMREPPGLAALQVAKRPEPCGPARDAPQREQAPHSGPFAGALTPAGPPDRTGRGGPGRGAEPAGREARPREDRYPAARCRAGARAPSAC